VGLAGQKVQIYEGLEEGCYPSRIWFDIVLLAPAAAVGAAAATAQSEADRLGIDAIAAGSRVTGVRDVHERLVTLPQNRQ